jgi:PEGA domain
MRKLTSAVPIALMLLLTGISAGAWPARAEAQHISIGIGFGFGYGYPYGYGYGFYNPWWGYPYGPYPAAGYYPYYGYEACAVRLQATPKNAEVFVDGYRAGIIDDFDGTFQRLSLPPGQHEITVYLAGFRTWSQSVQASPGTSQNFKFAMTPLEPGEANEPRPVPAPPQEQPQGQQRQMRRMPPVQIPGSAPPSSSSSSSSAAPPAAIDVAPEQLPPPPPMPPAPIDRATAGSISIRIQPGSADIYIDGLRWGSLGGGDQMVIQLAEGPHQIEVRKPGYQRFMTDVDIKRGEATPVNVTLKR